MGRRTGILVFVAAAYGAACAAVPEPPPSPPDLGPALLRLAPDRGGRAHEGAVLDLAVSPDGLRLATCGEDGTVRVFDARTGTEEAVVLRTGAPVRAIDFSEDGKYLAAGGDDGEAHVLAVDGWSSAYTMKALPSAARGFFWVGKGPEPTVRCIDGTAVFEFGGKREVFKSDNGMPIESVIGDARTAVTPKNCMDVALQDGSGGIRIERDFWNVDYIASRKTLGRIPVAHEGAVTALLRLQGSDALVSAGLDGALRSWDVKTLGKVGEILDTSSAVHALAASPDGKVLWVARMDGTVRGYAAAAFMPATIQQ